MDLIYTNKDREDVNVIHDYTLDLAYGSDENDFELTIGTENHCCESGCLIYIEDTEYGGIIDRINVVTKDEQLSYVGRTWHGVLESKVIQPDSGQAYLTVSGEANAVIGSLISRLGLSELFEASAEDSGLTISNYSFDRYTKGYTGIKKMLSTVSGKLNFAFKTDKVVICALPAVDYTQDEQFDSDQVQMEIDKAYNAVNHLICLGQGELTERQVVHLYVDGNGNISQTQTFTGLEEYADVYDYPNAESLEELTKSGTEQLQSLIAASTVNIDFDAEEKIYDIGDIIGSQDVVTKVTVNEKITKKIVTISQGTVNIEYKVGE